MCNSCATQPPRHWILNLVPQLSSHSWAKNHALPQNVRASVPQLKLGQKWVMQQHNDHKCTNKSTKERNQRAAVMPSTTRLRWCCGTFRALWAAVMLQSGQEFLHNNVRLTKVYFSWKQKVVYLSTYYISSFIPSIKKRSLVMMKPQTTITRLFLVKYWFI